MGISSLVYMHVLSNGWTAIKFVLIKSSLTLSVCKAGSIYVTVGCSSVCLFHRAPCGQEISIDSCMRSVVSVQEARSVARAGAQQQRRRSTALSSKCGQRHVDSRRTRLNTDLLTLICGVTMWVSRSRSPSRDTA